MLGVIGIALPILPTTPFILLASACFVRGNPRLHDWLHHHPRLGPILFNWQRHRAIEADVKRKAYVFILCSFAMSFFFAPLWWVRLGLVGVFLTLIVWFRSIPSHIIIADGTENH